ncbi:MAG: hypothetical protein Q7U51_13030 [Methanoregula sp.]|nr:hypothetical protein [Methanoregula sp.]
MRGKKDPWDKRWVSVSAVAGVIAVVIMALVFFLGGGNTGGQPPSGESTTVQATQVPLGPSSQSTTAPGVSIKPELIKEAPSVTVPGNGVFVKVSYIGGFAGTYGINGEMVTMRNSGERVFPLNASTGAVSATFHKEDGSTRHEIVVEIYKDGKALKFARNSSAYGEVSVNSPV